MADGDSRPGAAKRTRRNLDIEILLPPGLRAPGLAGWLQSVAPPRARGSVSVAVAPDARVRALNRDYRKKDANTDVLSFPSESPDDRGAGPARRGAGPVSPAFLGDIVIA